MAGNRKLPFGYVMQMGVICINEQEADIVRTIYERYATGASYRQLTEDLNTQEVPYSDPEKPWNKNMVARILSYQLYVGNGAYPAIIAETVYRQAAHAKPSRTLDLKQTAKPIRKLAVCAECGSRLELGANRYGWARWNCPTCNVFTADATTPRITNDLKAILTAIRKSPEMVRAPQDKDPIKESALAQAEQQFEMSLDYEEFDEEKAKDLALALATARFEAIGSEDYETMRIHNILSQTKAMVELDVELLRQITTAVLIHPDGAVSLKLKNGQIIERSHSK